MFISDHPHARLLKDIYEESIDADPPMWVSHIDDDFLVHHPGTSPMAGDFVGRDGFIGHLMDFDRASDSFEERYLAFYADDLWAFIPFVITAKRNGKTLEMPGTGVWRFSGPGRLAEHWELAADQAAWDAFWTD